MMSCTITYIQRLYNMDTFFFMNKGAIKEQINKLKGTIEDDQDELKQLETKYKEVCTDMEILEKLEKL